MARRNSFTKYLIGSACISISDCPCEFSYLWDEDVWSQHLVDSGKLADMFGNGTPAKNKSVDQPSSKSNTHPASRHDR
jgi:hypothetical protein